MSPASRDAAGPGHKLICIECCIETIDPKDARFKGLSLAQLVELILPTKPAR